MQWVEDDWSDDPADRWSGWIVSARASSHELGGAPYVVIPEDLVLAAASDHCPAAAYRGRCPGVDPEVLMRWRAGTRAAFQRRAVAEVLADVEAACEVIEKAGLLAPLVVLRDGVPSHCTACGPVEAPHGPVCGMAGVVDLRGRHVPEAPEASLRLGIPILADGLPGPDGRVKIVLLGDEHGDAVRAFLGGWAATQGLIDLYGDPARGFAGGYVS